VTFMLLIWGMPTAAADIQHWGLLAGASLSLVLILIRQVVAIGESRHLNDKLALRVEEITSLNEQIQRVNEELRQIDRFKSEFVSNVSHELRTPLATVMGYMDLVLDSPEEPLTPLQADCLRVANNNAQRMVGLVNDLLDLSRVESGRFAIYPALVEPGPLLRQLAHEMRLQAAEQQLTLRADLPEGLPTVVADELRLTQVINNLLANAIKFTLPGGQIRIKGYAVEAGGGSARLLTPVADALVPALPEGRWLVVCVEDTGPGIRAADLPHLFSRFYRTADAQRQAIKGTGLGLYLSKAIIEAHHGCIGVESEPGRGSKFWFALPVTGEQETRSAERGQTASLLPAPSLQPRVTAPA